MARFFNWSSFIYEALLSNRVIVSLNAHFNRFMLGSRVNLSRHVGKSNMMLSHITLLASDATCRHSVHATM